MRARGWLVVVLETDGAYEQAVGTSSDLSHLAGALSCRLRSCGREGLQVAADRLLAMTGDLPTIVYTNYLTFAPIGAELAARMRSSHVISHAGSDLSLLRTGGLSAAVLDAIRRANAVISNHRSAEVFRNVHGSPERVWNEVVPHNLWQLPASPTGRPFLEVAEEVLHGQESQLHPTNAAALQRLRASQRPGMVVGLYGKGDRQSNGSKQHAKIYSAVRQAVAAGADIVLVALLDRVGLRLAADHLSGVLDRCLCIAQVGPWHIPAFLRSVDVCIYLEKNFWLPEHQSQVPLEILAFGTCGFFSESVAKQLERAGLGAAGESFILSAASSGESLASELMSLDRKTLISVATRGAKALEDLRRRISSGRVLRPHHVFEAVATTAS